jgi:hypothetical protein
VVQTTNSKKATMKQGGEKYDQPLGAWPMNRLAEFVQRTEIAARFKRALLIFWLPLVLAAALPAIWTALTQSALALKLLWGGATFIWIAIWIAYFIWIPYKKYGIGKILLVFAYLVGAGGLVWLLAASMHELTKQEKAALVVLIMTISYAAYFARDWAKSHIDLR